MPASRFRGIFIGCSRFRTAPATICDVEEMHGVEVEAMTIDKDSATHHGCGAKATGKSSPFIMYNRPNLYVLQSIYIGFHGTAPRSDVLVHQLVILQVQWIFQRHN